MSITDITAKKRRANHILRYVLKPMDPKVMTDIDSKTLLLIGIAMKGFRYYRYWGKWGKSDK
jgi:hypothetical protein